MGMTIFWLKRAVVLGSLVGLSACIDWDPAVAQYCADGTKNCDFRLSGNTGEMDFKAVLVGQERQLQWTIKNNSTFPVTWQGLEASGNTDEFVLQDGPMAKCGDSLESEKECGFTVSFRPTSVGVKTAKFNLIYAGSRRMSLSVTGGGAVLMTLEKAPSDGAGTLRIDGVEVCGTDCTRVEVPVYKSPTVLEARSEWGSYFGGWDAGLCAGHHRFCSWSQGMPLNVAAKFNALHYNLAFVSSKTYPSNLGTLAAYDSECNRLAREAGLNNSSSDAFVAWIASASMSAKERLGLKHRGFIRIDGKPFVDQIVVGHYPVFNVLSIDENGVNVGQSEVLTGTWPDGTVVQLSGAENGVTYNCNDWTQGDAGFMAVGSTQSGPFGWAYDRDRHCAEARIYCLMRMYSEPLKWEVQIGKRIFVSRLPYVPGQGVPDDACKEAEIGPTKALISTSTVAASQALNPGTKYIRPDGQLIGTGAELIAGTIGTGLWQSLDDIYHASTVWTGSEKLSLPGTPQSTCNDWNSTLGTAMIGETARLGDGKWWKSGSSFPCTGHAFVYCVEQ
jgi:hypothetical protein